MGNNQTQQGGQGFNLNLLLQKYKSPRKVESSPFGPGQVFVDVATGEEIIVRETMSNHEETYKKQLTFLNKEHLVKHPNILGLIGFTSKQETQFCATFFKTILVYQYASNTLISEINKRKANQAYFSSDELSYLMMSLIEALAYLQDQGLSHGNLQPSTIFISHDRQYKITRVAEQQLQINLYSEAYSKQSDPISQIYLSPAQISQLAVHSIQPIHNQIKSDVFSLGVILLHAATLQSQDHMYDFKNYKIDENIVTQLNSIVNIYDNFLLQIIAQMLDFDEQNRPDFISLRQYFRERPQQGIGLKSAYKGSFNYSDNASHNNEEQLIQQEIEKRSGKSPQQQLQQQLEQQEFELKQQLLSQQQQSQQAALLLQSQQQPQVSQYNYYNDIYKYQQPNTQQFDVTVSLNNPQTNVQQTNMTSSLSHGNQQISYDDINTLLRKYGIEPIQSTSYNKVYNNTTNTTMTTTNPINTNIVSSSYVPSYNNYSTKQLDELTQRVDNVLNSIKTRQGNGEIYEQQQEIEKKAAGNVISSTYNYLDGNQGLGTYNNYTNYVPSTTVLPVTNQTYTTTSYVNTNDNIQKVSQPVFDVDEYLRSKGYDLSSFKNNNTTTTTTTNNTYQNYDKNVNIDYSKLSTTNDLVNLAVEQQKKSITQNLSGSKKTDSQINYLNNIQDQNQQLYSHDVVEYVQENHYDGSRYEGEKVNGKRQGRGQFFYAEGGSYDGQWYDNRMHGYGTLYYKQNQPAYEGEWVDDKFQGKGVLHNQYPEELQGNFDFHRFDNLEEFWVRYEGGFFDDQKEGFGIIYLTNGERYEGNFKKDAVSGQGSFFKRDGTVVRGVWENNVLQQILSN